jgi:hypothetical protein
MHVNLYFSYPDNDNRFFFKNKSAPGVTRTRGTQIRNLVLYPPELRGHMKNV